MTEARLDEFDKVEWFDVARRLKPGLTDDEYEEMWNEFLRVKNAHQQRLGQQ